MTHQQIAAWLDALKKRTGHDCHLTISAPGTYPAIGDFEVTVNGVGLFEGHTLAEACRAAEVMTLRILVAEGA